MTIEVGFLILNLLPLVIVIHDILYDYYYIKYYTFNYIIKIWLHLLQRSKERLILTTPFGYTFSKGVKGVKVQCAINSLYMS